MKKLFSLAVSVLLSVALALSASAVSAENDAELAILPVDVIVDQESAELRKVYDLPLNIDPSALPRDGFDRGDYHYECSDVLREVVMGDETRTLTQTETVDSKNKEMETILALLPQEKDVTTEDGFSGTLYLNLNTLRTEVSGYGSSTKSVNTTRTYPNLSSADASHLPKTITDGGRTMTLQNVQWQTDNTYNADDYEIGDRFTAICTYGGTQSSSYVKGYTTTAEYTGEVQRTGVTLMRYTVIFNGTPIVPADAGTTSELPGAAVMVPAALAVLAAGGGGTYLWMKRKEHRDYEAHADGGGN